MSQMQEGEDRESNSKLNYSEPAKGVFMKSKIESPLTKTEINSTIVLKLILASILTACLTLAHPLRHDHPSS